MKAHPIILPLLMAALLCAGCTSQGQESAQQEATSENQISRSGIIAEVNGNEIGMAMVSYTRTGETATYQIPVGATVTNLAGAAKDFNALATNQLVTIYFDEDDNPISVEILQSIE